MSFALLIVIATAIFSGKGYKVGNVKHEKLVVIKHGFKIIAIFLPINLV